MYIFIIYNSLISPFSPTLPMSKQKSLVCHICGYNTYARHQYIGEKIFHLKYFELEFSLFNYFLKFPL